MRRRLWAAGTVLVTLALVVGGLLGWRGPDDRTSFAWGVGHAPAGTQRASWTDWAAVRAHEGARLSAGSSTGDLRRFLTKAFDDDLSSASALVGSAPVLQQRFGFSPASVDWRSATRSRPTGRASGTEGPTSWPASRRRSRRSCPSSPWTATTRWSWPRTPQLSCPSRCRRCAADQAEGRRLLAAAGEVNPHSAFAMSDEPDGSVRVAFEFEGSDVARVNADSRAVLAQGPAPGQGGGFSDRHAVDTVTADGSLVVMRVTPRSGAYVLSDLSSGPVLFATC